MISGGADHLCVGPRRFEPALSRSHCASVAHIGTEDSKFHFVAVPQRIVLAAYFSCLELHPNLLAPFPSKTSGRLHNHASRRELRFSTVNRTVAFPPKAAFADVREFCAELVRSTSSDRSTGAHWAR
jgi:hypothetical protein